MSRMVTRDNEHLLRLAAPLSFLRRNLAFLLQREGLDLLVAADGREALHLAQKHRPSLIILDVELPGVNGFGVCRCLKEDKALGGIPVLLFSQDPPDDFSEKAWASGAYEALRVPFEAEDILEKVSHAIVGLPCIGHAAVVEPANGTEGFRSTVIEVMPGRRAILASPMGFEDGGDTYPRNTKVLITFVDGSYTQTTWQGTIRRSSAKGIEVYLEKLTKREQRRQAIRKSVTLQSRYRLPGDFFRLAKVSNLSVSGMRLTQMRGHLAVGMECDFALNLRNKNVLLQGEIRWLKEFEVDGFDVGVSFEGVDEPTRDILLDYLFTAQAEPDPEADTIAMPTLWTRLDDLAKEVQVVAEDEEEGAVTGFLQHFQTAGAMIDGLTALLEEERTMLEDPASGPVRDLVEQIVWEIDHLQARSAPLRNLFREALRA